MSRYTGEVRAIVLQFTLAPDGTLLAVSVISPSGLNAVNQAALSALRASLLPAFLPSCLLAGHAQFAAYLHAPRAC